MYRLLFAHQFMNDPKWYSGKILSVLDETDPEFWHDLYSFVKHSDKFPDQEKGVIFYGMAQNPFVPQSLFMNLFEYEPYTLIRHENFWQWGYQFFLSDDESSKKVRSVIEQHALLAASHDEVPLDVFERLFSLLDKNEKENLVKKVYHDPKKLEIIFKNLSFDDDKMFLRIINFLGRQENLPSFVFDKLAEFAAWKVKKSKEEESIKHYFDDLVEVLWGMVRKKESPREFIKRIGTFTDKVTKLYQESEEYKDIAFSFESSLKEYCKTVLLSKKEILSKWDQLNLRWVLDAYAFDPDLFGKLLYSRKKDNEIVSLWDMADRFDFVSKNEEDVKRFIALNFEYGNAFFLLDKMSRWPDHLAGMGLSAYFDKWKNYRYWKPNKEVILLLSKISPTVLEKFQEDFYVLFKRNHETDKKYYLNNLSNFVERFMGLEDLPKKSRKFWKPLFEKLFDEELLDFFNEELKRYDKFKADVLNNIIYGFGKFFYLFKDDPMKKSLMDKMADFVLQNIDCIFQQHNDYFISYVAERNVSLKKAILLYQQLVEKNHDSRFILLENPYEGKMLRKIFAKDVDLNGMLRNLIANMSAMSKNQSMELRNA